MFEIFKKKTESLSDYSFSQPTLTETGVPTTGHSVMSKTMSRQVIKAKLTKNSNKSDVEKLLADSQALKDKGAILKLLLDPNRQDKTEEIKDKFEQLGIEVKDIKITEVKRDIK